MKIQELFSTIRARIAEIYRNLLIQLIIFIVTESNTGINLIGLNTKILIKGTMSREKYGSQTGLPSCDPLSVVQRNWYKSRFTHRTSGL